jgi:hypothetical protein
MPPSAVDACVAGGFFVQASKPEPPSSSVPLLLPLLVVPLLLPLLLVPLLLPLLLLLDGFPDPLLLQATITLVNATAIVPPIRAIVRMFMDLLRVYLRESWVGRGGPDYMQKPMS